MLITLMNSNLGQKIKKNKKNLTVQLKKKLKIKFGHVCSTSIFCVQTNNDYMLQNHSKIP